MGDWHIQAGTLAKVVCDRIPEKATNNLYQIALHFGKQMPLKLTAKLPSARRTHPRFEYAKAATQTPQATSLHLH